MQFFKDLIATLTGSNEASAADKAGNRHTDSVMGEFLDAFGPTEEVRTEDAGVLAELMPDVAEPEGEAVADDPFADWGKSQ